jgi:thioredoxin-like negative regulator of GroEL
MNKEKDKAKLKFQEATKLHKEGNLTEARDILLDLDVAFPNNKKILFPLATVLTELKKTDEARRLADKLLGELGDQRGQDILDRIAAINASAAEPVQTPPPQETPSPPQAPEPEAPKKGAFRRLFQVMFHR